MKARDRILHLLRTTKKPLTAYRVGQICHVCTWRLFVILQQLENAEFIKSEWQTQPGQGTKVGGDAASISLFSRIETLGDLHMIRRFLTWIKNLHRHDYTFQDFCGMWGIYRCQICGKKRWYRFGSN